MIPIDYLALRVARRLIPGGVMHWMLAHGLAVVPGLETRQPAVAARRYQMALARMGRSLQGMCVLVLGYGGHYGLAVELLRMGARRVYLLDPYARSHEEANRALAERSEPYLRLEKGQVRLDSRWIRVLAPQEGGGPVAPPEPCDVILSWSVYEHLRHPRRLTQQLARLTAPHGCHLHFIDLRDHYFRRPFEMLCYSQRVWSVLLNPPSNLNRLRAWHYAPIFQPYFQYVETEVLESAPRAFRRAQPRIQPRFLGGDETLNCATRILVKAWQPTVAEPTPVPLAV